MKTPCARAIADTMADAKFKSRHKPGTDDYKADMLAHAFCVYARALDWPNYREKLHQKAMRLIRARFQ